MEGKALEACVVRSGEAGMGGGAWLCQSTAGMRPASSARLRCAGKLWAVVGRPLMRVYFGRGCAAREGAPRGSWSTHIVVATACPTTGHLQRQGRRRRRRSACRGRDNGYGLALRHGLPITESVLHSAAAARRTTGLFQGIPRDPNAMQAGTAQLRGRPHSMLRASVVFDCVAAWMLLGVRVSLGRRPRRRRRGWLACAAGGGGNFD